MKTGVNFRLFRNTRRRVHHALNGKSKPSSTRGNLGIDINPYKNWIEYQFIPVMIWLNSNIDHVMPIFMFDVSNDEELKQAFDWNNAQPLIEEVHSQKGVKNFCRLSITIHQSLSILTAK